MILCWHHKSHQNTSYATLTYSLSLTQQLFSLEEDILTLQIFIQSLDTDAPLICTAQHLIQALHTELTTLFLIKTLLTIAVPTLNQIKQVVQAESNYMIKELKASSSSAVSRLYTEIICFFINTTLVLKAHVSACASYEITIKSGYETSE